MSYELLRSGQMALRLGIPENWLVNEASQGKLPCLKAGNVLLFEPQIITQMLAQRARRRAHAKQ